MDITERRFKIVIDQQKKHMARICNLYRERVKSIKTLLFFIVSVGLLSGGTVLTTRKKSQKLCHIIFNSNSSFHETSHKKKHLKIIKVFLKVHIFKWKRSNKVYTLSIYIVPNLSTYNQI